MRITRLSTTRAEIEYVIHPNWGGTVPSWITELYIESNLRRVTETQEYFQALRGLEQWNADDGKEVGEVMVAQTKAEKHREKGEAKFDARMRPLFKKYNGLKEVGAKYEFFEAMMTRVVQNKLRPAGDVDKPLCSVSVKQGRTIGAGFAASLASNLTAAAAVDEWIGKYPALKELDREEVWFRPMMGTVALRLLAQVSWGLKSRLVIGAGLSVLDMASDINVIFYYSSRPGEESFGAALLGMILACMLLQLVFVYVQNRTKPLVVLKEAAIVLTGLKPG
jgi:hypothetical protein